MTVTTYSEWVAAGEPWKPSQPVADFRATLQRHGYTVYVLGNHSHATANPPEDHMPYSHTPWPGSQPYDYVLAMDIMPGGALDWHELGRRLVADKNAGVPGTEAIKYINWTNSSGQCLHEKWEPNHSTTSSSDTGHIHISFRTDYVTSHVMQNYDPVATTPVSNPKPPVTTPASGKDFALANWTNLKRGAKGDQVKRAQGLLIAHGLPIGSKNGLPDGDFGPTTESSTKRLQAAYHIAQDGEFGEHTLSVALYGKDLA